MTRQRHADHCSLTTLTPVRPAVLRQDFLYQDHHAHRVSISARYPSVEPSQGKGQNLAAPAVDFRYGIRKGKMAATSATRADKVPCTGETLCMRDTEHRASSPSIRKREFRSPGAGTSRRKAPQAKPQLPISGSWPHLRRVSPTERPSVVEDVLTESPKREPPGRFSTHSSSKNPRSGGMAVRERCAEFA